MPLDGPAESDRGEKSDETREGNEEDVEETDEYDSQRDDFIEGKKTKNVKIQQSASFVSC